MIFIQRTTVDTGVLKFRTITFPMLWIGMHVCLETNCKYMHISICASTVPCSNQFGSDFKFAKPSVQINKFGEQISLNPLLVNYSRYDTIMFTVNNLIINLASY
jgi:hypothetical protein